jgi:hypothetical protein
MQYIGNAFSLQMLTLNEGHKLSIEPISFIPNESEVCVSVVGHPDTAAVLGVKFNRANVKLQKGDILYVAQLVGGRLPEGATSLPEGFSFAFVKVEVLS